MNNRIALSLKPDLASGRWQWSLAGEGFSATGAVDARDREDAVICALGAAYGELAVCGPVSVVVALVESARLWSFTEELEALFSGVTLTPYTDADHALRAAALAALEPAPAVPTQRDPLPALSVATDGSASRGRVGWGWLASDGQHDLGSKKPAKEECDRRGHVVLAELRAISEAIAALPGRPLKIRSDSKVAIGLVREWMQGSDRLPGWYAAAHYSATRRGGLPWMQQQVRKEAHRIDICWVRGHAGDALNEGADSLAKLARRAPEGTCGFTTDDVPARAKAIADAFAPERHQLATAA
jgi:ribonuclease HI